MNAQLATWTAIIGVSLTTIVTRGSFVVFASRLRLHPLIEEALRYAPAAVLGALVVPALVLRHGHVDFSLANQRLIAACVAALVMWRLRSMIWAIAAGMGVATLLRIAG
ncbi:MAG: AzlD domain-containing protein [Steroidobacterales bacterium]